MDAFDLTSLRFGRFTVLKRAPNAADRQSQWLCQCDCGQRRVVKSRTLRDGISRSCGCLLRDATRARSLKHGHCVGRTTGGKVTATYRAWCNMLTRCHNKNLRQYPDWGGRGIKVCKRWLGPNGFRNFLADMGERPDGKMLDRINNDGDYKPSNCHWATRLESNRNRRKYKNARA